MTDIRVRPLATVKPVIGRAFPVCADAQERAEGIEEWVETPVKAEGKFVEVGLQVLRANAVVCAAKPAFQVAKGQVDDRQIFFRHLGVVGFDNRQMVISELGYGARE